MAEKQLLQNEILTKLRVLRKRITGRLLWEGVAWLMMALIGLFVVTLVFDYALRLDRVQRGLILGLCAAGVAVVVWRHILQPLLVPLETEELALLVENRYPTLADRLISALQLTSQVQAASAGMSVAMIERMAEEANQMAGQLEFHKVVESERLKKMWLVSGLLLLMLGGFGVVRGDVMNLWFQRSILLADIDWPQNTYLNVYYIDKDGQLQPLVKVDDKGRFQAVGVDKQGQPIISRRHVDILRGDDLQLVVTSTGSIDPHEIVLHANYPSVGDTEDPAEPLDETHAADYRERLGLKAGNAKRRVFVKTIPMISEEVEFYVTGGDDERDGRRPHKVRLVAPPALAKLEFKVELPSYMRKTGELPQLDGSSSVLTFPLGSTVHVTGRANKPLTEASILIDGKPAGKFKITNDKTGQARQLAGEFTINGDNRARVQNLKFLLTDTMGYTNRRAEERIIQVQADRPPRFETYQTRAIRSVVAPQALIPAMAVVRDEYGVAEIRMTYQIVWPEKKGDADNTTATPEVPKAAKPAWLAMGKPIKPTTAAKMLKGERQLDLRTDVQALLDAKANTAANGKKLKMLPEGTKILLQAVASDYLPSEYQGPNRARSVTIEIQVISKEKMLMQLEARQKELRQEFVEMLLPQQQFAVGRMDQVVEQLHVAKSIEPLVRTRLSDAHAKQKMVLSEVGKAVAAWRAVALEMEYNRVVEAKEYQRVSNNIVRPLQDLQPKIRDLLTQMEKAQTLDNVKELSSLVTDIRDDQNVMVATLKAILKEIGRSKSRMELARRMESILRKSVELQELIKERDDENKADIFDN